MLIKQTKRHLPSDTELWELEMDALLTIERVSKDSIDSSCVTRKEDTEEDETSKENEFEKCWAQGSGEKPISWWSSSNKDVNGTFLTEWFIRWFIDFVSVVR